MNPEEAREPTRNDDVSVAYRELVHARKQYRQSIGTRFESMGHDQYHEAIFNLFDELSPRLKRRDIASELWEDAELWPGEPIYHEVAMCPACGGHHPVDGLDEVNVVIGEPCPTCGDAEVVTSTFPKIDEDGQVEYRMVEGLSSLSQYRNRFEERTVSYEDALGTHEETRTEKLLLDPYQLEIAADVLSEAMEVLGLFPDATMKGDFQSDEVK
mgnify:CR=1 FL=1